VVDFTDDTCVKLGSVTSKVLNVTKTDSANYLANHADQKNGKKLHQNREIAGDSVVGVWMHMDS